MNVNNISVGTIATYKKLCGLLDEPYHANSGNVKTRQLKDWNRFFAWEKIGLKFKITEIFSEPKAEITKARNVKFTPLICHLLMSRQEQQFTTSFKNLLKNLGMMSPDFSEEHRQNTNLDDVAFGFIYAELNKRLKSALKSMQDNNMINLNIYNVKILNSGRFETELMTEEENEIFSQIEIDSIWMYQRNKNRKVFTTIQKIRLEFGFTEYMKIKNELIKERLKCNGVMKEYHIELTTHHKYYQLEKDLQGLSIPELEVELNTRLNDSILKTLETKLKKDYDTFDYQRYEPSKDKIKKLIEKNRFRKTVPIYVTDEEEIRELEHLQSKYGTLWDDSDEEYIPDDAPF